MCIHCGKSYLPAEGIYEEVMDGKFSKDLLPVSIIKFSTSFFLKGSWKFEASKKTDQHWEANRQTDRVIDLNRPLKRPL